MADPCLVFSGDAHSPPVPPARSAVPLYRMSNDVCGVSVPILLCGVARNLRTEHPHSMHSTCNLWITPVIHALCFSGGAHPHPVPPARSVRRGGGGDSVGLGEGLLHSLRMPKPSILKPETSTPNFYTPPSSRPGGRCIFSPNPEFLNPKSCYTLNWEGTASAWGKVHFPET